VVVVEVGEALAFVTRAGDQLLREVAQALSLSFAAVDADAVELRVLGSLIEKQRTTPDAYPLSLNALQAACNQSTNRDPVVDYDEAAIREALEQLGRRGWTRLASGPGSRAVKHRHLLAEALGLSEAETALLGVLLLRGPQTPGELRQRVERLHPFGSWEELEETIQALVSRGLAARLARRPGQKEQRYAQLLGETADREDRGVPPGAPDDELGPRVAALEARVDRLEAELGRSTGSRSSA